jgi:hypothetical protein
VVVVVEFGAAAELSVSLAPGEAAAVRAELEDELSGIGVGVGGGAAGALDSGGGSALTDGGIDTLAGQLADQTDLLEDILDELEAGGIGGGGGGGGPLSFLAGGAATKAAGAASGAGLLGLSILGPGLAAGGVEALFSEINPGGITAGDIQGQFSATSLVAGSGTTTPGDESGTSFDPADAPLILADALLGGLGGGGGAPTDEELPGNLTREQIRENRQQGDTPFTEADIEFQTGGSIPEPDWLDRLRVDRPSWLDELGPPDRAISGQGSETTTRFGEELGAGQRTEAAGMEERQARTRFGEELGAGQRTGNRAAEQRETRGGDTEVNVTQEFRLAQRQLEQAMEEAKRRAVNEVERKVTGSRREGL